MTELGQRDGETAGAAAEVEHPQGTPECLLPGGGQVGDSSQEGGGAQ